MLSLVNEVLGRNHEILSSSHLCIFFSSQKLYNMFTMRNTTKTWTFIDLSKVRAGEAKKAFQVNILDKRNIL